MQKQFELYQIVGVALPEYSYRGEVISRPTPEGTIMVRRVPNHPGTIEEHKLCNLYRVTGRYRYVHYAIVTGYLSFPIDMLRYDQAAPVNFGFFEADGRKQIIIDAAFGLPGLWIAMTATKKLPDWTPARWKSFGWSIKHQKTEPITPDNRVNG